MLARYNQCVPNGADRIIALAERQAAHRQHLESAVVTGNVRSEARGQVCAFFLCLVAVLGGIYLIANDKNVMGLAAIITAFASVAGIFVYGRYQQQQERERKRREMREREAQQRLPYQDEEN